MQKARETTVDITPANINQYFTSSILSSTWPNISYEFTDPTTATLELCTNINNIAAIPINKS